MIWTIGIFALMGFEFNLSTVAAILTIAGYSINDTVVVYDRVRENLRKYKKMPLAELLNNSINQTLSRTVMTSITIVMVTSTEMMLQILHLGTKTLMGMDMATLKCSCLLVTHLKVMWPTTLIVMMSGVQ